MGSNTGIAWTDHTYNPWQGCTQVTAGCDQCYMFRDKIRYGQNPEVVVRSKPPTFNLPLRQMARFAAGKPDHWRPGDMVFTCSWSDFFHPDADGWRDEAWGIIRRTPYRYQILTKRPNRIAAHLPADWGPDGYDNVWLGVSVEYQKTAFRIDQLARVPARVRFVSYEPAIGPLSLIKHFYEQPGSPVWLNGIKVRAVDWVITGGESGGLDARPFDPQWALDIDAECRTAGIAHFVKQMGSRWARGNGAKDPHGADPEEWPDEWRVRDFPDSPEPQAGRPLIGVLA